MGPFSSKFCRAAASYSHAEAKASAINTSKIDAGAPSSQNSSPGEKDKQRTNAGFVVHNVDESSSRSENVQILDVVVEKITCLSAPLVSTPDAELFWVIKAPSGLRFLGNWAGVNDCQYTSQIARSSVLIYCT